MFGAVAYGIPSLAGLVAFLNPWRQKAAAGQWIRVASLASLPAGGPPQRFSVVADRSDAWNRYPAEPIGGVFLRRTVEQQVTAIQILCPHAGCLVALEPKTNTFFCPCHAAQFDLEGKRTEKGSVCPRDLDMLEVEVRDGAEVWVRFEKFQTGTPQKIVKT